MDFYFNFNCMEHCNICFLFIDSGIYLNTFCLNTSFFDDELFIVANFNIDLIFLGDFDSYMRLKNYVIIPKYLNIIFYKLFIVDSMGINIIFIIISFILLFIYFIYDLMYIDLIVCYIFLECVLLLFVLLNCVFFYIFWDIRFLIFSIFLIAIAACEIAIGLSLLVRYK